MILEKNVNAIERSGIAGETVFSFAFNKKMYDLMSTNLYSDRIGSTVRETCSNAWDAHMAAGKVDIPFHVTLPTNLEPHFIVEDFGTGMPNERAIELYSTLGLSTKEQSNDMIGAFGLGSKSPFTVTDTFTLENTYEGITYHYMCFKNESGFPSILQTGSEETDRGNGVKVSIPVAGTKYHDYAKAMIRQLIMMDPKPIITNSDSFEFKEAQEAMATEDGFILENANDFGLVGRTIYGKMGIVLYPIDSTQIRLPYTNFVKSLGYGAALVLKFNIGDLDPLPSREGLTYDTEGATVDAIMAKYGQFEKGLRQRIRDVIEKETSPYNAWKEVDRYHKSMGVNLFNDVKVGGYTIGALIHEYVNFEYSVNVPERLDANGSLLEAAKVVKTSSSRYMSDIATYSWRDVQWSKDNRFQKIDINMIENILSGQYVFVLNDEEVTKHKRARYKMFNEKYLQRSGGKVFYMDQNDKFAGDRKDWTEFKKAFDDFYPGLSDKFVLLSSIALPKVVREKGDPATHYKGCVVLMHDDFSDKFRDIQLDEELDADKTFYITCERDIPCDYSIEQLKNFMSFAGSCDLNLVVIRKGGVRYIKNFEDQDIFELKDFINNKFSGYKFTDDFKKMASVNELYAELFNSGIMSSSMVSVATMLAPNTVGLAEKYFKDIMTIQRIHFNRDELGDDEKIIVSLRTLGIWDTFKDTDWQLSLVSSFKEEFLETRKQYNKAFPLTDTIVKGCHYFDGTAIGSYVNDMTQLLHFKERQFNTVAQTVVNFNEE